MTVTGLTESGVSITCGHCGKSSDLGRWTERPVSGSLPAGQFQCPECGYAFQRCASGPWKFIRDARGRVVDGCPAVVKLIPCEARL